MGIVGVVRVGEGRRGAWWRRREVGVGVVRRGAAVVGVDGWRSDDGWLRAGGGRDEGRAVAITGIVVG